MNKFKSILTMLHTQNKSRLHELFTTRYDKYFEEALKIFEHQNLKFRFSGTNFRTPEKQIMQVYIPLEMLKINDIMELSGDLTPVEDYILRTFSYSINALNASYANSDKVGVISSTQKKQSIRTREKCSFQAQNVNEIMTRRNGVVYDPIGAANDTIEKSVCIKIYINMALINGVTVNGKSSFRAVRELMELIYKKVTEFDFEECRRYIVTYQKQQYIRKYLADNGYIAFIANGSVLPRYNGTSNPMADAVPFTSPPEDEIKIAFDDGIVMSGLGIKKGVTVITGGGYSGKSTLLDAIESGIYNHIPNDGREFVITCDTALKVYAEDGRPVNNLDMSPFYKYFPNNADTRSFSTSHASGSVSQAANIIEAVYAGSRVLLIDEDKSATNFMIRDKNMRLVVEKEPIIPYTDRIRELCNDKDVSTILVIGGSSEYLSYADTVILMDDYTAKNITNYVKSLDSLPQQSSKESKESKGNKEGKEYSACWIKGRYMIPIETNKEFIYFRTVTTENAKKITLDEYSSDITLLTSLISENQLSMLTYIMEQLLILKDTDKQELPQIIHNLTEKLFSNSIDNNSNNNGNTEEITVSYNFKAERWFENVRPLDVFCAVSRMRGINFKSCYQN